MSQYRRALVVIILASQFLIPALQAAPASEAKVKNALGALPLRFETNAGQVNPEVRFVSRGNGYSFFLTSTDAIMAFSNAALRMKLLGSSAPSLIEGLDELPGRSNYFQGSDPGQWPTNLPSYAKVRYAGVYPGIDVVYYGNGTQLEYDFVVAPGASAASISIGLEGTDQMRIDDSGDLVLLVDGAEILLRKPVAYQESGGSRREVPAQYVLRGSQVHFQVGTYDLTEPLIIDPVLSYSTFLGGSGADAANALAVDAAGNMYITGSTTSLDFPTANPLTPNAASQTPLCAGNRFSPPCSYIFVTKVTADGSALVYSSYLGGGFVAYGDTATGIAVDAAGNAYVTGNARSSSFPIVGPVMNQGMPFVLKLNPTGSTLIYSTHFGGSNPGFSDSASGIGVNANGEAYVGGTTGSPDFPAVNSLPSANCADGVPFVTKFNAAGSALMFSTCLPAPQNSLARAFAVDAFGNAYLTGELGSDSTHSTDAFVAKLSSSGSLIYSARLGGSQQDIGFGIAADAAGNAYVTGNTSSTDFPSVNAFQPTLMGPGDAFVTKLDPAGSILYSTFLGGNNGVPSTDLADSIAVDGAGRVYVAGITSSPNFPTVNAIQSIPGGNTDAFLAELSASGSTLIFSSYLGGSAGDRAKGIAVDSAGNIYVTGWTQSPNFPTMQPLQASYRGAGNDPQATGGDVFAARISNTAVTTIPAITSLSPNTAGLGSQLTATVSGQNLASLSTVSFSGAGVSAAVQPGSLSDTRLVLTIGVAVDATLGTRSLTIGTPSGIVTLPNALLIEKGPAPTTIPLPIPDVETGAIRSGYVFITPAAGGPTPQTTLTFGMVSGGVVQSQAGILPMPLTTDSSLQVDTLPTIGRNLGMAIANPHDAVVTITLTLRNEDGTVIASPASFTIPPRQQRARFVTEFFPVATLGTAFRGSISVQSSLPVSLVGLRFSGLEFSTLATTPNSPGTVPLRTLFGSVIGGSDAVMFPQFAISGGWATELGLVNTTSNTISGRIDIFDAAGNPMAVKLNYLTQSTFFYSIPANGSFTLAPRDANGQSPF